MADTERADEEPTEGVAEAAVPAKGRRSFARLRRELTDEELNSPGVQKILIDETERLENECSDLRVFVERFYDADKQVAVLTEQRKRDTALDVFIGGALAVGSALIGYAPNVWAHQPTGYLAVAFGVILVGAGVAARWITK